MITLIRRSQCTREVRGNRSRWNMLSWFWSWANSLALGCWLSLGATLLRGEEQAFIHPGLRLSDATLQVMSANLKAGNPVCRSAYEQMLTWPGYRDATSKILPSSLDYPPHDTREIIVGAYERPHTGQDEVLTDATAAYIHAMQWYVQRNPNEAKKSLALIQAISTSLTRIDPAHNGELAAAWSGNILCETAELLRSTYPTKPEDWTAFERLLRTVYYPIVIRFTKSEAGNWKAASTQCVLAMGVFLNDRTYYNQARTYFLSDEKSLGSLRGYVFPDGTTRETKRDQLHEQMGVLHLVNSCEIAWTQGEDLYSTDDNRLLKGLESTAERVLTTGVLVYDGWDIAYQHYHERKHLPTPKMDALRASKKWSGETWRYWTCGLWPKLTHRLPLPESAVSGAKSSP
jgi:Alginate lyase